VPDGAPTRNAAFSIARAYVALGEPDSAFSYLDGADWRWPHRGVRSDSALDPLHTDPDWRGWSRTWIARWECAEARCPSSEGLDVTIGENGMRLSGGERRRIAIARALLRRPELLISDEATSALDSLTEDEITETVKEVSLSGERITILVAHRLSRIMRANRIYVLERGRVVEQGDHESLLVLRGLNYAMWRQQIGER
jgi:ABC-type multidrug transport system fused ATPase/permease subunit